MEQRSGHVVNAQERMMMMYLMTPKAAVAQTSLFPTEFCRLP